MHTTSAPAGPHRAGTRARPDGPRTYGARSAGLRLGALYGPAVFGVTAAGVALPRVAEGVHASAATVVWVLTVHSLALGVGTALFGRLADAFGIRRSLLAGSLLLALGAAVCVVAPNLGVLVIGRLLLATGSGAMTNSALTLGASRPEGQRREVLATFGATMVVFSAAATFVGGVITEALTWRITVVLPALSLLFVPLCLGMAAARPGAGTRVDVPGAGLLTTTATALILLIQAPALGLSLPAVAPLALVLVAAVGVLARRVVVRPDGFVPRALVADPVYVMAGGLGAAVYGGLFAAVYAVPQILIGEHGWSVTAVGTALLPGALLGAAVSRLAGLLAPVPGGRRVLAGVTAAAVPALAAVAIGGGAPWLMLTGTALLFASFATTQVVVTAIMSARIPLERRGAAMGLLTLGYFTGGAVGSALAGVLADAVGPTMTLAVCAAFPAVAAGLATALRGAGRPRSSVL